jgi:hypothetical protein
MKKIACGQRPETCFSAIEYTKNKFEKMSIVPRHHQHDMVVEAAGESHFPATLDVKQAPIHSAEQHECQAKCSSSRIKSIRNDMMQKL